MPHIINLDSRRVTGSRHERTAVTERGGKVMEAVVSVAKNMLTDRWAHELAVVELARVSGVARASLFWQFPKGLPDIINTVLLRELNAFDDGFEIADQHKRFPAVDRVMLCFEPLFNRAEVSGRLYANLRGAMFTWGRENTDTYRCGLNDYVDMTAELLTNAPMLPDSSGTRVQGFVAEGLFNTALDILGDEGKAGTTWKERREVFRAIVATTVAGLAQLAARPKRPNAKLAKKKRVSR